MSDISKKINSVIFLWSKNKKESLYQIHYLLSIAAIKTDFYILGEKKSGIKSTIFLLKNWIKLKKIDYARKSIFYVGKLKKNVFFERKRYIKYHTWKKVILKVFPGVFGYKKIDLGSKILCKTFLKKKKKYKKILDVGCGTGILSIFYMKNISTAKFTLLDNNSLALRCANLNLKRNKTKAKIIPSNIFSNVKEKFNLIISNPPFHIELKKNFNMIKNIIISSKKYLFSNGELRIVINSSINLKKIIKKIKIKKKILKKTNNFSVFQFFFNKKN